jgi:hypothetical protein
VSKVPKVFGTLELSLDFGISQVWIWKEQKPRLMRGFDVLIVPAVSSAGI